MNIEQGISNTEVKDIGSLVLQYSLLDVRYSIF